MSLTMTWDASVSQQYKQSLTVSIGGTTTTPVVVGFSPSPVSMFSGTQCQGPNEYVAVEFYNVNKGTERYIGFLNAGSVTWKWPEIADSYTYDPATDRSRIMVQNIGGVGLNVTYGVFVSASGVIQQATVLDSTTVPASFSFAEQPYIAAISPRINSLDGGELIIFGSFHGFNTSLGDNVTVGGTGAAIKSVSDERIVLKVPAHVDFRLRSSLDAQINVCGTRSNSVAGYMTDSGQTQGVVDKADTFVWQLVFVIAGVIGATGLGAVATAKALQPVGVPPVCTAGFYIERDTKLPGRNHGRDGQSERGRNHAIFQLGDIGSYRI
jgi:IPT/TIG domain